MVQEYTCIPAVAANGFCIMKPCPELHGVNHRDDWRQKFLACVVGEGISVRER